MGRCGGRHDRVWEEVQEACASEPNLKAELEQLYARARSAAASTGADDELDGADADELDGEMECFAATTLHAALSWSYSRFSRRGGCAKRVI
jgi:hypothetical protein